MTKFGLTELQCFKLLRVYKLEEYFFGTSLHHLKQINCSESYYKIPIKYTFQAGARFSFDKLNLHKEQFAISPLIIFQQQKNYQLLRFSFYFIKKFYSFGISFQQNYFPLFTQNTIIIETGLIFKNFSFNYSYDISTTKLWKTSFGTHEISLLFRFNCKENNNNNTITCPAYEL